MYRSVLEINEKKISRALGAQKNLKKITFVFSDPDRNNFQNRASRDWIHSCTDGRLVALAFDSRFVWSLIHNSRLQDRRCHCC